MKLRHGGVAILLAAPLVLTGAAIPDWLHREGPPPGHTGGFGEPSCQVCHQEYELNQAGGSLTLLGLPDRIEPGVEYALELVLNARGTDVAGFQVAARTTDGRQAGTLIPVGPGMAVDTAEGPAGRLHYLRHTRAGTRADGQEARWTFRWTAPSTMRGEIRLHAAANSANGDNSPFGDLIFTTSATAYPTEPGSRTGATPKGTTRRR